jgi:hypothetical protein
MQALCEICPQCRRHTTHQHPVRASTHENPSFRHRHRHRHPPQHPRRGPASSGECLAVEAHRGRSRSFPTRRARRILRPWSHPPPGNKHYRTLIPYILKHVLEQRQATATLLTRSNPSPRISSRGRSRRKTTFRPYRQSSQRSPLHSLGGERSRCRRPLRFQLCSWTSLRRQSQYQ